MVAVTPPGRVPGVGVAVAAPGVLVLVGVFVGAPGVGEWVKVGVIVKVLVGAGVFVGPQPGTWTLEEVTVPQLVSLMGPRVTELPRASVMAK